jgi:hypothetical protein
VTQSLNIVALARADYETAMDDLDATEEQAFLVAVGAFAWRVVAVLLPTGCVVSLVLLAAGVRPLAVAVAPPAAAACGPLIVAMFVGLPASFVAGAQPFYRGSRDARLRFGAGGSLAYLYYGWRYAFRGRLRPWGAMTVAEKRASNPRRAALYWPESSDSESQPPHRRT